MPHNLLAAVGPQIKVANTLIEKELNNRIASLITEYNLTGPQITLLVYLSEAQGQTVTQKEVADKFVLSHPTIRSIVKRLEKNHLIELGQLANDKRQVTLLLTDQGAQLLAKHINEIRNVMEDVNRKIVGQLSPQETQELLEILAKIKQNF
ncbi:MarR family transcriptional regulator [Ligilactobacillus salitolerans]|uniref:MarR family transcriptional regulator n=1 Tax=Ligilactobacillus salitolerans TaxID=1808352 RepID=A0A401IRY8_9LACO|nr:MarR family winged helix-turn-helix transcriptional regulator [Ligilactobacillus salitolerans]GBG94303.1 MarR family transcriptional regulator [Ligilactobacillus salitolerans]